MPKQYADVVWNPKNHKRKKDKAPLPVFHEEIDYTVPAAKRGIDMLLSKFKKEAYKNEVFGKMPHSVPMPKLSKPLSESKIAFVTDGGLVPNGNPDNLSPVAPDKFCIYSFMGKSRLCSEEYVISHQGYDSSFVREDPNRLVPLDAARKAENEGKIRKISDIFYSTAGVMLSVEKSRSLGHSIALSLYENEVDGVILTSTCGTSTRAGAYIACEIEYLGIPVVQVTNLTQISEGVGCSRILKGNNISFVFGSPELSLEQEFDFRVRLFDKALELLTEVPKKDSCIVANIV